MASRPTRQFRKGPSEGMQAKAPIDPTSASANAIRAPGASSGLTAPMGTYEDSSQISTTSVNLADTWDYFLSNLELKGDLRSTHLNSESDMISGGVINQLLHNLVQDIIKSFFSELEKEIFWSDSSSVRTRASPTESSSSPGSTDISKSQHHSKKRASPDSNASKQSNDSDGQDNEESDEDWRRKRRKEKEPTRGDIPKSLRCPFFSHDPEKYGSITACSSGKGFPCISALMQHIKRKHVQPQHCPRCQKEMNATELLEHIRVPISQMCRERRDTLDKDGRISFARWKELQLKGSNQRHRTTEEKWSSLYRTLFPSCNQVPSPSEKPIMIRQFEPYLVEVARETLLKYLGDKLEHFQDMIPEIVAESKRRFYAKKRIHEPQNQLSLGSLAGSSEQSNSVASHDMRIPPEQSSSSASFELNVAPEREQSSDSADKDTAARTETHTDSAHVSDKRVISDRDGKSEDDADNCDFSDQHSVLGDMSRPEGSTSRSFLASPHAPSAAHGILEQPLAAEHVNTNHFDFDFNDFLNWENESDWEFPES